MPTPTRRTILIGALIGLVAGVLGVFISGTAGSFIPLVIGAVMGGCIGVVGGAVLARAESGRAEALVRGEGRKREAATVSQDEPFESILNAMHEGIVLFEPNGRVRFVNPSGVALLGAEPHDVTHLSPATIREVVEAAQAGERAGVECEIGAPGRWLHALAIPGATAGDVLLVVRDITESRRLDGIRTDFVANASHELKTPVASIQAIAETISAAVQDDPSAVVRFTERLEREASRLGRIVSDLLDLSRLETTEAQRAPVDLAVVVTEEVERLQPEAAALQVALTCVAPEHLDVIGDARDLRSVVRNLVDNALRYTGEAGHVTVTLHDDDSAAVVRVEDDGVGIPQRDIPRVFERFYRVDRARARDTGGTGLGLAIVKHAVEGLGGTIEVRSELGVGSTFDVRIPDGRAGS